MSTHTKILSSQKTGVFIILTGLIAGGLTLGTKTTTIAKPRQSETG